MDQEYVDGLLDVTGEIARDEGMKNRFFDIVITRTMERFGCTAEEAAEFFGEVFSEAYGGALANLEDCE